MYEQHTKVWIYVTMAILFALQATALSDVCRDVVLPSTNCTMFAPVTINCTQYNYTIFNASNAISTNNLTQINNTLYKFTFNQNATTGYTVQLCDGSTRQIIVDYPEDTLSSLSVSLFFMTITLFVFFLPRLAERFTKSPVSDMAIKRACWIAGMGMCLQWLIVTMTIQERAGLGLTEQFVPFITLLGAGITVGIIFLFFKTVVDIWTINKEQKEQKTMGRGASQGDDDE